jgi:hypothetical protein
MPAHACNLRPFARKSKACFEVGRNAELIHLSQSALSLPSQIPNIHKRARLVRALSRTSTREYATETWSGT